MSMADPNAGLHYEPGVNTIGILYNGEDGRPRISTRFGHTYRPILPEGIGRPIHVCSSSNGIVAFYNPRSNRYYIGNPQYPDSYIPLPPTPRQHSPFSTNVVLATEFSFWPTYHLICAHVEHLSPCRYTFDTYSSFVGRWLSYTGIDVGGYIIPNTGVSCGTYAYWLRAVPRSVIRYNVYNPHARWDAFLDNMIPSLPGTRIQLGTIWNQLCIVSIDISINPTVTLYLLEEDQFQWAAYATTLSIMNLSPLTPRPIRFQSTIIEVFFWHHRQMMIWENVGNLLTTRVRLLNEEEIHAADGIAHVSTPFLPENFPVAINFFD